MADTETKGQRGQSSLSAHAEEVFAVELPIIAGALKRLLASLDMEYTPCCTCGLKIHRSYNDVKAAETFHGTLRKVLAYGDRIAGLR